MDVKKADGCKCIPHAHPSAFLKNQASAPARCTRAAFWARCLRVHTPGEALALGQLPVAGKHSHFQITRLLGAALHAQMADRRVVKLAGWLAHQFQQMARAIGLHLHGMGRRATRQPDQALRL